MTSILATGASAFRETKAAFFRAAEALERRIARSRAARLRPSRVEGLTLGWRNGWLDIDSNLLRSGNPSLLRHDVRRARMLRLPVSKPGHKDVLDGDPNNYGDDEPADTSAHSTGLERAWQPAHDSIGLR